MLEANYVRAEQGLDARVTQIGDKLNHLHQMADIVLSLSVRLEERLQMVTRPYSNPLVANESKVNEDLVPLAFSLNSLAESLSKTEDILESLLNRIEV